jgi:hypothetical protein
LTCSWLFCVKFWRSCRLLPVFKTPSDCHDVWSVYQEESYVKAQLLQELAAQSRKQQLQMQRAYLEGPPSTSPSSVNSPARRRLLYHSPGTYALTAVYIYCRYADIFFRSMALSAQATRPAIVTAARSPAASTTAGTTAALPPAPDRTTRLASGAAPTALPRTRLVHRRTTAWVGFLVRGASMWNKRSLPAKLLNQ